jgi:hypothetical protein
MAGKYLTLEYSTFDQAEITGCPTGDSKQKQF